MEYLSDFFFYIILHTENKTLFDLFFVLSGAVGHYICRYNGLVFVKSKSLERIKMTSLTSLVLFFWSSTNEHFEGKNCQMNFNVERNDNQRILL